jgi:hypothetical protein
LTPIAVKWLAKSRERVVDQDIAGKSHIMDIATPNMNNHSKKTL